MPFKNKHVTLSTVGDRTFRLEEDLCYQGSEDGWVVPAGFETDFATVPQMVTWLIPTYGKYTLAAILHDYFCIELRDAHNEKREPFITSLDTDGVFRRVMRELGVPLVRRWLMWTGVRWGALFNKARRKGIATDLPLMMLVSVLAFPIVASISILAGIGLLIDKLVEKIGVQ